MDRSIIRYGAGLLLIVFANLSLLRCVDPIPFEAEDEIPKIIIFGSFTQRSQDHTVSIRQTTQFGTIGFPIDGASVEIVDDEENGAKLFNIGDGQYLLPEEEFCGEIGKAYKLVVTFSNERRFESTWEMMTDPVQIEEVYFEVEYRETVSSSGNLFEQFFIDIFIDTPLKTPDGNKAFLRWEVDETYSLSDFSCGPFDNAEVCYFKVPGDFEGLKIFSSIDDTQEDLKDFRVFSRLPAPYIEFAELHYFNVYQYSLSESTYEYWDKIDIVSNPTGSIFDKIPAGVGGNIFEIGKDTEVLGYFEVAALNVDRVLMIRQQLNEFIQIRQECNPNFPARFQPDYCCYCWLLPNSIPKPDYWGER